MTERPSDLPDYSKPPIDEVAISLQFSAIDRLIDDRIRDYWRLIRDEYPIGQVLPRIEAPIESLEPTPVQLQIPLVGSPLNRMWLISESDDFLVQVQNTRFIQNWRRREDEYPRFERIKEPFWNNYLKFKSFLAGINLPPPVIQQVEVTYINWIPDLTITRFFRPAANTALTVGDQHRQPEEQNWTARYLIQHENELIERLYVQCLPAIRPQTPDIRGTQFGLTFRAARSTGISENEADELIDSSRIVIVNAFTELTTATAHESWGRFK